ncbi:MAG: type II toxin-antitoxin system RelE/ParE family toxin [Candidatus Margulisbacteria bacterium]|nr:type II toxin-antitoxin system RelE/ParE family toxin [Candidatus Margulisiibacteriota bacterium]
MFSKRAEADLFDIWSFVRNSTHSEQVANTLLDTIQETINHIIEYPNIGTKRPEIDQHTYSFPCGNYNIYYDIKKNKPLVNRIFHSSRDIISLY